MKKLFVILVLALVAAVATADTLTIRGLFTEMPDSIIPYLSRNNRLDFIDFMDSKMKAEVTNDFGGKSLMTALSDDSLSIRLNEACRLNILLLTVTQPVDSSNQVIALVQTIGREGEGEDTNVEFYSVRWRQLQNKPILTADGEERIKRYLNTSNILKIITEKLNKY
jgi:hypothetical protein